MRTDDTATLLVGLALASGAEFFHTPDGDAYVRIPVRGHHEILAVLGRGLRQWLSQVFHATSGKVPNSSALSDAVTQLAGRSRFEGAEYPVFVRVAAGSDVVWLDLGGPNWNAIRVSADGWDLVSDPPIRFRRSKGLLALPEPIPGTIDALRPFVNVSDDDQFVLLVAWLTAALRGRKPFPVLSVTGEQGSAKTTLCGFQRRLIDPNVAPTRLMPREPRDLMVAASNSYILSFDNVSQIPPWLSDALCCLATGIGFATRELYTDADEAIFTVARPVMLNGITDIVTRPDLLDRALLVTLKNIPDDERRSEAELEADFTAAHPVILGALLGAVSAALRDEHAVHLASRPRMADFVTIAVAACAALPWPADAFLSSYANNRDGAIGAVLEGDPVADAVIVLAEAGWAGTATELLEAINEHTPEARRGRRWFTRGKELSAVLRRLAPALRRTGVLIDFGGIERGRSHRLIHIRKAGDDAVTAVTRNRGGLVTAAGGGQVTPSVAEAVSNAAVTPVTAPPETFSLTQDSEFDTEPAWDDDWGRV